jgi:AraC-like DNA-binding protein/ligand-binding sensor protein
VTSRRAGTGGKRRKDRRVSEAQRSDEITLAALSRSPLYRGFERAFARGTGLPLFLHAPHTLNVIRFRRGYKNPLCALTTRPSNGCLQCRPLQRTLEEKAQLHPKTMSCLTGLSHTAVPVRVGDKLIAFLHTGHVLLHQRDKNRFNRVARKLTDAGLKVDLKKIEEAYFKTRILPRERYESFVGLVKIFAKQLAAGGNQLGLHADQPEPAAVTQAREIIDLRSQEGVSLGQVAKLVNVSANYFSELFHKTTGIRFVDYVARVRVEKAKSRLLDPRARISEVAYAVGFQSLSQFNRAFKKFTGEAPNEYRMRSGVPA